jgi:hypothetical protein
MRGVFLLEELQLMIKNEKIPMRVDVDSFVVVIADFLVFSIGGNRF